MKTIRFSVTPEEYEVIQYQAECRGEKPAPFAKMATFAYINKYPAKGLLVDIHKNNKPLDENADTGPCTL